MTRSLIESVLIVGAGPAGLAVAALLKKHGIAFLLLDKNGRVGGAYNEIYSHMQLASPAKYVSLPGYALRHTEEYINAGQYLAYLQAYARHFGLQPRQATVEKIEARDQRFCVQVRSPDQVTLDVSNVVLATGLFGSPLWPDDIVIEETTFSKFNASRDSGKEQAPVVMHAHDWQGVDKWLNKRVLIIGSATSAVEIAEEFAQRGTKVVVSSRDRKVKSIPQRLLGRDVHDFLVPLAYLPNWMLRHYCRQLHTDSDPATFKGFKQYQRQHLLEITGRCTKIMAGRAYFSNEKFNKEKSSNEMFRNEKTDSEQSQDFDLIIFATGYRFDYSYLSLGKSQHEVLRSFVKGESQEWPGLYIMGNGCVFGKPSQFIWGISHDAPLLVAKIVKSLEK